MKALGSAMLLAAIGLGATGRDVGGQTPNAVVQAPDHWTYGSGTDSCGQWIQNKRANAIAYPLEISWVYGYVSAMGEALAGFPISQPVGLAETDVAAIKAWMDDYCAGHPLDNVSYGATKLVAELVKRKRENNH